MISYEHLSGGVFLIAQLQSCFSYITLKSKWGKRVSGKPHVPVAADHSRIKLVRKVSALF